MVEVQEGSFESPAIRETLLDVVLDRLAKSGKNAIFTRIIYVARFVKRENSADVVEAFQRKLIEKNDHQNEVTGMLVVYPTCMLHLLEAKTSTLMAILRDTIAAQPSESNIAEARVIASTEDIPSRSYGSWLSSFVNSNSTVEAMDPCDASAIVKTASEVNAYLRKVGQSLVGLSDSEIRRSLSSIEGITEGLPAPEMLLTLTPADDAPTIAEYLDIFSGPINMDLDSESVWPIPPPLRI